MNKILTLCLSAGIQKTIEFSKIWLDKVNRSLNYRFDIAGKAVNSARVLAQLVEKFENHLSEDIDMGIRRLLNLENDYTAFFSQCFGKSRNDVIVVTDTFLCTYVSATNRM